MNLNKARDFYSAYYEGTLDAGLTQAFERSLTTEAEVKAEYEQFVRIMEELKGLQEPVDVPDNLHQIITERVDAHILASEGKDKAGSGFFAWRPLAYGAVAAAAIIGVVMSISSFGSNGIAKGGIDPSNAAPTVVNVDGVVRLQFTSAGQNGVTITEVSNGEQLFSRTLSKQRLDSPLLNTSDHAVVVLAEFTDEYPPLLIGVPGKVRLADKAGIGSFTDFIKAVVGSYSMPVVVDAEDAGRRVSWMFENSDVVSSVSEELEFLGLQAELREDGLLWISPE